MNLEILKFTDLKSKIQEANIEHNQLKKIIKPFINIELNRKQLIEVCQVGKFVLTFASNTYIISKCESPDFIISYNGESIGLELESIMNKVPKNFNSIKNLIYDASDVFKDKYPGINLLVNIYLKDNNFNFKKVQATELKNSIADCIYDYFTLKNNATPPDFIESIDIYPHSKVVFSYNPGAYYVESLSEKNIIDFIKRKEKKVKNYIHNSSLQKQWLLMMIGTIDPNSYDFDDEPLDLEIESDFDRIFIMADYSCKIIEIKTKKD